MVHDRKKLEALLWKHTSPDFKSKLGGVKQVLTMSDGATRLVPISSLTDAELFRKLPNAVKDRIVDAGR